MGAKLELVISDIAGLLEISDLIQQNMPVISMAVGMVFLLFSFFGFKLYREVFAILMFLATACLVSFLGKGRYDWGGVTAVFSVTGVIMGFLGYRFHKLGGVCMCVLLPFLWLWEWGIFWPYALLAGGFAGLFAFFFPVLGIEGVTAVFGAFYFFLPGKDMTHMSWMGPACAGAGFCFQYLANRKQKLFQKTCPDRIRYYLEKRRVKHDSVPKGV